MNRRNFFKNLGAATVGVIVAPVVVANIIKEKPFGLIPKPTPPGWAEYYWVYSTPGNTSFYSKDFVEAELKIDAETDRIILGI
jgi:hypothetical protein